MRSLALGRYHVLSRLRTTYGAFAATLFFAALPLLRDTLFATSAEEWLDIEIYLISRAQNVTLVYCFHVCFLLVLCDLFGTPPASRDGTRRADLLETTPITSPERFFGDAFGIFQCAGAIHLCTLPLLALAITLSPLPTATFFWLEGVVLAALVFGGAAGSWKLRSTGKWMRTRTARSMALFFILLLVILIAGTRWEEFRDALLNSLLNPSPIFWKRAVAAIDSVPLLFGSLLLLYAGYIVYFAFSSIRAMERGHGGADAL